ncbi:MAG: hypothetical protein LIO45_01440, partial [Clostridiales bacterium]|nr:hypothetical protein [Clostridiales bacterium]
DTGTAGCRAYVRNFIVGEPNKKASNVTSQQYRPEQIQISSASVYFLPSESKTTQIIEHSSTNICTILPH